MDFAGHLLGSEPVNYHEDLFLIRSPLMVEGTNKPVINVASRNLIIDSFQATPASQPVANWQRIDGWDIKMNIFNVLEEYALAGSHGVLEVKNALISVIPA